jgi:hypothetical protein
MPVRELLRPLYRARDGLLLTSGLSQWQNAIVTYNTLCQFSDRGVPIRDLDPDMPDYPVNRGDEWWSRK